MGTNKQEEKRYYFLKLPTDFFNDRIMKKLRKLPGGDVYTIIALKLLLLGLNEDNKIYIEGVEETEAEELALAIDEDPTATEVVFRYFINYGWLVKEDNWTLYATKTAQMTGSITARGLRKQQQKAREREDKTELVPDEFRSGSTEIEIEKELEIEIDIEQEGDSKEGDALPQQKPSKSTRFIPPTTDEIKAYCSETGRTVDAERFVDFYSSKGWMVGKNKMKDWKAAVRNWERMEKEKASGVTEADRAKARLWGKGLDHQSGYTFEVEEGEL